VPGFFACWTRKEAFLKATGDGFWFPLVDFSVTTHPDLDPRLEDIKANTEAGKQWFLADVSVVDGFRATLALERCYSRLETYAWTLLLRLRLCPIQKPGFSLLFVWMVPPSALPKRDHPFPAAGIRSGGTMNVFSSSEFR
jgi:hypothetical protein